MHRKLHPSPSATDLFLHSRACPLDLHDQRALQPSQVHLHGLQRPSLQILHWGPKGLYTDPLELLTMYSVPLPLKYNISVVVCSSPQPFWHQGPVSWKAIFPQMRGWGRGEGGWSSGSHASDGEQDEASLAHLPTAHLLLCGQFLTDHRSVLACGPGVGDP